MATLTLEKPVSVNADAKWVELIEDTFRSYSSDPAGMKTVLILLPEQGQFVMMHLGWEHGEYVDQVVAHLELRGDEILVHDDNAGMNYIAANLIAQGVPRDKITVVAHPDWYIQKA